MKKGYKAFNLKDGKLWCMDAQYVIGETYTQSGKIEPCVNGLHYCENLLNIGYYYDYESPTIICEVEDLGSISINRGAKTVTNKLKIIGEIEINKYPFKCDKYGNVIYKKDFFGNESFYEYEYDNKGNMICKKYPDGSGHFYKYDGNSNIIYEKDYDNDGYFYGYDKNNNMVYKKYPDGDDEFWRYDENNNIIYKKHYDGEESYYKHKYDKNNNKIYTKYPSGVECFWEYDSNNNMIYYRDENGNEFKMVERGSAMKIRVKENIGKKSVEMFGETGTILKVAGGKIQSDKMWVGHQIQSAKDLNSYVGEKMHPDFYTIFEDVSDCKLIFGYDDGSSFEFELDSVTIDFQFDNTAPEITYYEIKENVGKKSADVFGEEGMVIKVKDGIIENNKIWIGSKINSVEDLNKYIGDNMHPDFYTIFKDVEVDDLFYLS